MCVSAAPHTSTLTSLLIPLLYSPTTDVTASLPVRLSPFRVNPNYSASAALLRY